MRTTVKKLWPFRMTSRKKVHSLPNVINNWRIIDYGLLTEQLDRSSVAEMRINQDIKKWWRRHLD